MMSGYTDVFFFTKQFVEAAAKRKNTRMTPEPGEDGRPTWWYQATEEVCIAQDEHPTPGYSAQTIYFFRAE